MKGLLLKAAIVLFAIAAYVGSPFATAWSIREAVRNGNAAYLQAAIDWTSVRETLKPALTRLALNLPDPETQPDVKPGMWTRFKAYWGRGAVERAIDGYVTPEGLPKLFAARKAYRDFTNTQDETASLPVLERMTRAWARVKRAEFTGLTSFEIDMADKSDETRIFLGKLELTGSGWILRELRVKFLDGDATAKPATSAVRAMPSAAKPQATARTSTRSSTWGLGFVTPANAASAKARGMTSEATSPAEPRQGALRQFFARAREAARPASH